MLRLVQKEMIYILLNQLLEVAMMMIFKEMIQMLIEYTVLAEMILLLQNKILINVMEVKYINY
jgi:hypothetical protein